MDIREKRIFQVIDKLWVEYRIKIDGPYGYGKPAYLICKFERYDTTYFWVDKIGWVEGSGTKFSSFLEAVECLLKIPEVASVKGRL